jgi:pyruvate/oxaloacetate carboxyltransferase
MTLPDERYRAVQQTAQFLQRLAGGEYPRTPRAVREEASRLLRHYPGEWDMQRAADAVPEVFQQRMEDLHRFILKGSAADTR